MSAKCCFAPELTPNERRVTSQNVASTALFQLSAMSSRRPLQQGGLPCGIIAKQTANWVIFNMVFKHMTAKGHHAKLPIVRAQLRESHSPDDQLSIVRNAKDNLIATLAGVFLCSYRNCAEPLNGL